MRESYFWQSLKPFIILLLLARATPIPLDQGNAIQLQELELYIGQKLKADITSLQLAAAVLEVAPGSASSQTLCNKAAQTLSQGSFHLQEGAAAASILVKLRCSEKSAATSALPHLWQSAQQEPSVAGFAAVLSAAQDISGLDKVSVTPEQAEAIGKLLTDIKAPSGKARLKAGGPVSILATGQAYQIIAHSKALKVKWSGKSATAVTDFTEQISEVLEGASSSGLLAAADGNGLQSLAVFLDGGLALKQETVASSPKLNALASYVSSFATVGSLEEAVWLSKAKRLLKSVGASAVRAEIVTPHLSLEDQKKRVEIETKDESGKLVAVTKLKATVNDSQGKKLVEDSVEGDGGRYYLNLREHISSGGIYRVSLTTKPGEGGIAQSFDLVVKESSQYKAAKVELLRENDSELSSDSVEWPNALSSSIDAPGTSFIQVTLTGPSTSAASFLRLQCPQSNEALAIAFRKGWVARIAAGVIQEELECQEVEASIQPYSAASDTTWTLGTIRLTTAAVRAARVDLHAPKPTITHLFRKPDKRPMEALSVLFAGVAALPLAGLIFGLHSCKANIKGLQQGGPQLVPAFVFHASLVGLVLLYSAFWLKLNLLQTLPLLAALALVLSVSGYFLLSQLSALRLKHA